MMYLSLICVSKQTNEHAFQDRAWKEQTTSIFDLEQLEIEAERRGESAPWANPDGGDELFPGFGPDGKMQIGGT
jgi:hypothetical protein